MAVFNPYLSGFKTAVMPWQELHDTEPGITDIILSHSGLRVSAYRWHERRCPDAIKALQYLHYHRPATLPSILRMVQTLEIARSRQNIIRHGPTDKLTVTFRDVVSRDYLDDEVEKENQQFFLHNETDLYKPLDVKAVCAAISAAVDYKQTWTDVSKIRLVRGQGLINQRFYVELVRQGADGEDEIVRIGHDFSLVDRVLVNSTALHIFARRLSEELHLRHALVNGVDEYSVQ